MCTPYSRYALRVKQYTTINRIGIEKDLKRLDYFTKRLIGHLCEIADLLARACFLVCGLDLHTRTLYACSSHVLEYTCDAHAKMSVEWHGSCDILQFLLVFLRGLSLIKKEQKSLRNTTGIACSNLSWRNTSFLALDFFSLPLTCEIWT